LAYPPLSSLACVASLVPPLALLGLGLVGFVSLVLVLALLTTVLALLALFRNAKT
jgi:heme/copper-type cytochrome/quinol oxidase subunit 1